MENKELDKFFGAAKGQKDLLSPGDAEKIINQSTNTGLFGDFLRRNKMNLIVTSAAILIVASGWISGLFNQTSSEIKSNQKVENVEILEAAKQSDVSKTENKLEELIQNNSEINNNSDDLAFAESESKEEEKAISSTSKENRKSKVQNSNKLKVEGVNPIELTLEELKELGIISKDGKSLEFNSEIGKDSKVKIVLKPQSYDWSFQAIEELESIAPSFVTDSKGNKRISLFSDGEGFGMLESFNSGNQVNNMVFPENYTNIINKDSLGNVIDAKALDPESFNNYLNTSKIITKDGKVDFESKYLNYLLYDAFTKSNLSEEDLNKLLNNSDLNINISEETKDRLKVKVEPVIKNFIQALSNDSTGLNSSKLAMAFASSLEQTLKDSISNKELLESEEFGKEIIAQLSSKDKDIKFADSKNNAFLVKEQAKEAKRDAEKLNRKAILIKQEADSIKYEVNKIFTPGTGSDDTSNKIQFQQNFKFVNDSNTKVFQKELVYDFDQDSEIFKQFANGDTNNIKMKFKLDSLDDESSKAFSNLIFGNGNEEEFKVLMNKALEQNSDAQIQNMKVNKEKIILNNDANEPEKLHFHTLPKEESSVTPDINSSVEDFVDINEMIPVSVKFDGKNTDYILWFAPTDEFFEKLPARYKLQLAPEMDAIADGEVAVCGPAPSEEKAVMDVWRGCSGALKNLKVYPNPATTKVTAEFDLEELRSYKLTINDMNGGVVKSFQTEDLFNNFFSNKSAADGSVKFNGPQTINLDLTGIESGMYYVVVETAEGEVAMQRLIVNR